MNTSNNFLLYKINILVVVMKQTHRELVGVNFREIKLPSIIFIIVNPFTNY